MKKIVFSILSLAVLISTQAQQRGFLAQTSQGYVMDNPATTGLEKLGVLSLNNQSRWVGFDESPTQNFISFDTRLLKSSYDSTQVHALPISNPKLYEQIATVTKTPHFSPHGLGFKLARDVYGPFSRVSVLPSYAYHKRLNDQWTLAGGVALGLTYDDLDETRLTVTNPEDPTYQSYISSGNIRSLYIDGQLGLLLYSPSYTIGYSINQIFMNNPYSGNATQSEHELLWHHTLSLGYYSQVGLLNFGPYLNLRGADGAPLSLEMGLKAQIANRILAGVIYQQDEAIGGRLGFIFKKKLLLNYTYRANTGSLSNYNQGIHEIGFSFLFQKLTVDQLSYLW